MTERRSTGGRKEFSYTEEDLERIRNTDTPPTKEFKEEYRKWQERRIVERDVERKLRLRQRNMMILLALLFGMLFVLLTIRVL
jgi:hypothetical protein